MFNKKILCIGNETELTNQLVSTLAINDATINHGLISTDAFYPENIGYYHTSIADIAAGAITLNLAKHFDLILMLDQDIDSYPHWKSFVNTFRLMLTLEQQGFNTIFRDNIGNTHIIYWYNILKTNKSLCALPFTTLSNDYGYANLCMKNSVPVTKINSITDWATDPAFTPIRNNMLAGIQMPDTCRTTCYGREETGNESPRQFESLEMVMNLRLTNVQDLKNIKSPIVYDIRPSNKCNIMCRMCDADHSHLIEEENKKIGFTVRNSDWKLQAFPYDKINFDTVDRIYWAGGEPTVMPEFYEFLRNCIKQNRTDFDLNIGTNGQKISETLLTLLKEFPRVTFSVSFDGYKKVNDYVRWLSNFEVIESNCHRIINNGHILAFQTVFSMYNATRIHEIYEFYDREFPGCNTLVQPAGTWLQQSAGPISSYLGPWHNPLREQVLESMYRCRETKVYYNNGRNTNDLVEEVIARFKNYEYDPKMLAEFFQYNDKLDQARGSRLGDYIPELEQARALIFK
jgi:pyruvate-formate lyase-activating enzyme